MDIPCERRETRDDCYNVRYGSCTSGSWGSWHEWGMCQCYGDVLQYRFQECDNPRPARPESGGIECPGDKPKQARECSTDECDGIIWTAPPTTTAVSTLPKSTVPEGVGTKGKNDFDRVPNIAGGTTDLNNLPTDTADAKDFLSSTSSAIFMVALVCKILPNILYKLVIVKISMT